MQRDKKDHFLTGFIVAIISPIIFYGILLTLLDMLDSSGILTRDQLATDFHTRTLSLVALGCNAFFMNYFNKKKWINAMRGMVIPTLALAGYWLYLHYDKLF